MVPRPSMQPAKPMLLMVTSTLPRWDDDAEPRFVLDLCHALSARYRVVALAPHAPGAAIRQHWGPVEVRRYRYFFQWGEQLAYDGGILPKLRQRPWLWCIVPFFLAAQTLAIARVLRRDDVSLIHAHWLIPQGLCARVARILARSRTPLVATAHGADVFALKGGVARVLQRWVARGCCRIGAVSTALADALADRGVPRRLLRVLPMGIAIPDGTAPARDPDLIAFAGRIVEKKGVGVLLEAFRLLSREHPRARLAIAGAGPELQQRRSQAREAGLAERVDFLGAVPHAEVEALFARAAVAVMPSITARDGDAEGLGLVMLEAMSAGTPVVVSDLAVVRDVVRPGENGLVFPEGDAAALALALGRLLTDRALAGRLAARARSDVSERYSWSAVADRHAAAYGEAVRA